jgi:SAM-dependent methyltransferase
MSADAARPPANPQKEHYETIHDAYQEYYDAESMAYRERFIYGPLFRGLDLDDRDVADLACGGGATSKAILSRFPRARTFGIDLSARACADYRASMGRPAFEADLTRAVDIPQRFDAAVIIGGLHHCVADLSGTMRTIHGLLRPGGLLLMMEPSDDFFLAAVRRFWYRRDRYFDADTEHALSHPEILKAAPGFTADHVSYVGGPGYFLVLNSMVFRLPRWIKKTLARPLMLADLLYNRLPGSRPFPIFLAQWRRA